MEFRVEHVEKKLERKHESSELVKTRELCVNTVDSPELAAMLAREWLDVPRDSDVQTREAAFERLSEAVVDEELAMAMADDFVWRVRKSREAERAILEAAADGKAMSWKLDIPPPVGASRWLQPGEKHLSRCLKIEAY